MSVRSFALHLSAFLFLASPLLIPAQTVAPGDSAARPLSLPAVASVIDCSMLTSVDISQAVGAPTHVKSAVVVDDGKIASYCKVLVQIEKDIDFEVHLPVSSWNQRFLLGTRCEDSGAEQVACPPDPQRGQFAITVTNGVMNHRFHEDIYGDDYQLRVDFAYRGVHLLTVATKALVAKYYGQAPKFSYFAGCSEHGREAMMEAQRFPEDFNGIIAGAAPSGFSTENTFYYAWNILKNTGADGKPILTADKLAILHKAVLAQCDAADGVKDGLISDPLACHPDVTAVECKAGQSPESCLTSDQVHAAQELYKGAHDAQGKKLVPSGELPGSELLFPAWGGGGKEEKGTLFTFKYMASDPNPPTSFTLAGMKFDEATFNATTNLHGLYDPTDPDMKTFAKEGRKLILWHGLADPTVSPLFAIDYYTAMRKLMGAESADSFSRLYLAPGVGHCTGGDGLPIQDILTPIMAWTERGIAPGALIAKQVARSPAPSGGQPEATSPLDADRTRPVYPYPYTAQYTGKGSIDNAANFVQGPARTATAEQLNWLGSASFYTPGYEKWCTATGAVLHCQNSR